MTADSPQSSPADDPPPPRKRGRWQFGLSTLLLVVTACAVASWWFAPESWEAFQERFTERIEKLGGYIEWGRPGPGGSETPTRISFQYWGPWVEPTKKALTDEQLRKLRRDLGRLGPFALDIGGTPNARGEITDAGLEHLEGLLRLECLCLRHTDVTDVGLEHLSRIKGLQFIDLRDTKVTAAGICLVPSIRPDVILETDWTEKQLPEGSVSASGSVDNPPIGVPARITVPLPKDALGTSMVVRPTLSISLYSSDPDVHVKWLSATEAVMSLHGPTSDSGVFIARLDATNPTTAKLVWQAYAQPLGVRHSEYHHDAHVFVQGDRCVLVSDGAATFVEIRDLATGALLKRWVY